MNMPQFTVAVVAASSVLLASSGSAAPAAEPAFSFALLGDVPYGDADVADFPDLVVDVNNDTEIDFVAHAGDIKSGATACTDDVLRRRADLLGSFEDPLWLTPGDNEWTDCQSPTPAFDPIGRLDVVRSLFFGDPTTMGASSRPVASQSTDPAFVDFVENSRFTESCVTFGAIHQVGSDNGNTPWSGETPAQREARRREMAERNAAGASWVDEIFDAADEAGSSAVFVLMHARTRDAAPYREVHDRLRARASGFAGPVIVANGDEHGFVVDDDFLGVENMTRWQTPGGVGAVSSWIRVDVDCSTDDVFAWREVVTGSTPATTTTVLGPTTVPSPTTEPEVPVLRQSASATNRADRFPER